MKIGKINQQGDITTRPGTDTSNPEAPNGESFNITTGDSATGHGGSINLITGIGSLSEGSVNLQSSDGESIPSLNFHSGENVVSVSASPDATGDTKFILPAVDSVAGQFLKAIDNDGKTEWETIVIPDVTDLENAIDEKIPKTDATTVATANKLLYLDDTAKLPASVTGNASTATSLETPRTISISSDATGSASFDGSANADIAITLANSGVTAGNFTQVTVDSKGRVTTGHNRTITGTTNQVAVTNGDQVAGNPTISIANDPILPGHASVTIPHGTTAERPTPVSGMIRYNDDTNQYELVDGSEWINPVLKNDPLFFPRHVLIVSKNPSFNEFSSVKTAVESITDATIYDGYLILVQPGNYVEDAFTLPPSVCIQGYSRDGTVLTPSNPDTAFVTIHELAILRSITFSGANGLNGIALDFQGIGVAGSVLGQPAPSTLEDVVFTDNTNDINIFNNTDLEIQIQADSVYFFNTGTTAGRSVQLITTGTGKANIQFHNFSMLNYSEDLTEILYLDGPGSLLNLHVFNVDNKVVDPDSVLPWPSNILTSIGTGVRVRNGGTIILNSGTVNGFNNNIWTESAGATSTLIANNVISITAGTNCLWVEDPYTVGSFNGTLDRTKVTVETDISNPLAGNMFSIAYQNVGSSGAAVVGSFFSGINNDNLTDVALLIAHGSSTGLYFRGELEPLTGLDLKVNQGLGYYIVDDPDFSALLKRVNFAESTVTLTANSETFLYVNSEDGMVQQGGSYPDLKHNVYLGRVVTDASSIIYVDRTNAFARNMPTNHELMLTEAIGSIYASGSVVSENTSTDGAIDITAGNYFLGGSNFKPQGGTAVSMMAYYHTSGNWTTSTITTVPSDQYDNGTGLTNISAGKYTKHTLYVGGDGSQSTFGDVEIYYLVYGNAEYSLLNDASAATLPSPPPFFTGNITPIAALIMKEGQDSIVEVVDIRPLLGSRAPSTSVVTSHGQLTGLSADDHPQYLLASGARAMTGTLDLANHNIINPALIGGLSLAAHGARHNPNNADGMATAAPTTSLSPSSSNDAGIANSYSRSDHVHQITGFQPVDSDLTAIAGLTTNGIIVRTSTGNATTRSIVGTTAQITISDGDGISGNPTIGLSSNPIIPGTESLTLPIGTTVGQPASPTSGMIRFNSTNNVVEYYNGTAWKIIQSVDNWTFTGDVTGTGNGTVALTIAPNGVTSGTYQSVVVDSTGRVTSGSNPTTLSGYGITDAQPLDGDLTSIAGLVGTSGSLIKTAANTWALDTTTYLTSAVTTFSGGTTGLTPASATSGAVTLGGVLSATNGGTGQSSYAIGDILFASTTSALSKLSDVATGNVLLSGGVGISPSYGKVGLTTHVSGTLPITSGGTGATDATTARSNLGLTIGTNVQAWDADLDAIAALAGTSGLLKKTAANTWTLDTTAYLSANQTITLTGDTTGSGTTSIATTIANSAVSNAKMANMPTLTIKGNNTGGSAAPQDLTVAQVKTMLNLAGTNSGDQTITLTGDVTGTGTGTFATTLSNTGVTAGTYNKVTVDAKGRITSAQNTPVSPYIQFLTGTLFSGSSNAQIAWETSTAPTSTQGTAIFTRAITPSTTSANIYIQTSFLIQSNASNSFQVASLFRGTTCVGSTAIYITTGARPYQMSINFIDTPNTTSPITYVLRVGSSQNGNTWYINYDSQANRLGGTLAGGSYLIAEI